MKTGRSNKGAGSNFFDSFNEWVVLVKSWQGAFFCQIKRLACLSVRQVRVMKVKIVRMNPNFERFYEINQANSEN